MEIHKHRSLGEIVSQMVATKKEQIEKPRGIVIVVGKPDVGMLTKTFAHIGHHGVDVILAVHDSSLALLGIGRSTQLGTTQTMLPTLLVDKGSSKGTIADLMQQLVADAAQRCQQVVLELQELERGQLEYKKLQKKNYHHPSLTKKHHINQRTVCVQKHFYRR